MQRFLLHTYTPIPEVYTLLLLRDLKTKKVRHQHPQNNLKGNSFGKRTDTGLFRSPNLHKLISSEILWEIGRTLGFSGSNFDIS